MAKRYFVEKRRPSSAESVYDVMAPDGRVVMDGLRCRLHSRDMADAYADHLTFVAKRYDTTLPTMVALVSVATALLVLFACILRWGPV